MRQILPLSLLLRHAARTAFVITLAFAAGMPLRAADAPAPLIFNRARFFPVPGRSQAMVGGRFSGSNSSPTTGFRTLATIEAFPTPHQWNELAFPNDTVYRWIRYEGPFGSHGEVAEVEFYSGQQRLTGPAYGSIGEREGPWQAAVDGKTDTWFDSDTADGQFVGIDLRERATAAIPGMSPAPGEFPAPVTVALQCPTPGATIRYTIDGTMPSPTLGLVYTAPIHIEHATTILAVSLRTGAAPSPFSQGTYLIGADAKPGLSTFHLGNSLTDTTHQFGMYARAAGYRHQYQLFTMPGAPTRTLWDAITGDEKARWEKTYGPVARIDDLTLQPRDFNVTEEADYDIRFLRLIRQKSPDVQPWLYTEWSERQRRRPTDLGKVPSSQMTVLWPALSWEESMSAMLLYVEELQHEIAKTYHEGKPPRVLPSAIAMGWARNLIEHGKLPGIPLGQFYPELFRDGVHPNENGAYLVDLTWYAAMYRESPEGKVPPIGTDFTRDQAIILQRLAWDTVKNYPDCGLYEAGDKPVTEPKLTPGPRRIAGAMGLTLASRTQGAWCRYTLDGTVPTRTRGYLYCGVISVRPGMTVKAIAFKSGMADSAVMEAAYPGL